MLQYRHVGGGGEDCLPRKFQPGNVSLITEWTYALETGLVEMLLQSEHRTLDPEEAGEGASGGVAGGWVPGGRLLEAVLGGPGAGLAAASGLLAGQIGKACPEESLPSLHLTSHPAPAPLPQTFSTSPHSRAASFTRSGTPRTASTTSFIRLATTGCRGPPT